MEKKIDSLNLEDVDDVDLEIPIENNDVENFYTELCLVGRFLTDRTICTRPDYEGKNGECMEVIKRSINFRNWIKHFPLPILP